MNKLFTQKQYLSTRFIYNETGPDNAEQQSQSPAKPVESATAFMARHTEGANKLVGAIPVDPAIKDLCHDQIGDLIAQASNPSYAESQGQISTEIGNLLNEGETAQTQNPDVLAGRAGQDSVEGQTNGDTLEITGAETIPETPEAQAEALRNAELEALETQIAEAIASGDTELLAQLNAQKAELEAANPQLEADLANIAETTTPREFVEAFARMMAGGSTASSSPRSRSGIHGGRSGTNESFPNGAASEMFAHAEGVAQQLGVEAAAVKAVVEVESAGQMNATRFEPHIHARYPNVAEPKRTQLATSYGAFQIMGFNHEVCGFNSPQDMITAMATPQGQLQAFAGFIQGNPRIHNALKAKDWATFASGYNGPAYAQNNYDNKMAAAYARHSNA